MDLQKLFAEAKKLETAKIQPNEDVGERKLDDRILYMKAGNTYRCRLVYRISEGSDRKLPFITKEVHTAYGVEVPRGTPNWVVCPTTEYVKGRAGFKDCPICADINKWYKEIKTSPVCKGLYETFKRRSASHAVVYVVSDPTNADNNGKMKIIKLNHDIETFLKWEVFGINLKDTNLLNEDAIGPKAFDFNDGYDILFTVVKSTFPLPNGTPKEFDKAAASFSRRSSKINIDEDTLQDMFEELKFDADFYSKTSQPDLLNWYNNVVLKNTIQTSNSEDAVGEEVGEEVAEEVEEVQVKKTVTKKVEPQVQEKSVKQAPKTQAKPVEPPKPVDSNVDDIDMDDIMNIIDGIGK